MRGRCAGLRAFCALGFDLARLRFFAVGTSSSLSLVVVRRKDSKKGDVRVCANIKKFLEKMPRGDRLRQSMRGVSRKSCTGDGRLDPPRPVTAVHPRWVRARPI